MAIGGRVHRQQGIAAGGTAALLAGLALGLAAAAEPHGNPITRENAHEGARDWQLTRVRLAAADAFRSPWIEGYCDRQSVAAGERLRIMVSTKPAARFGIEIFRMGFYGGRGARLMRSLGPFDGREQPTPAPGEKNLHACAWEAACEITIPDDWTSGVYLGRLALSPADDETPGYQSYVIFIVRDERPCDVLFQCSDNTWQAYNRWPDNFSVYTHPRGGQGPWAMVSFDRPYGREAQFRGVVDDPLTVGSGEFLPFEFPLAYWLEERGYDVSYVANADMLTPDRGLKAKAFVSVGHDEYWDRRQFDAVTRLRDEGVSLLFLSGNSVCWVAPLGQSAAGQPARTLFRGGPYGGDHRWAVERERDHGPFPFRGPDEGYLMGARNVEPVNGGGDWVCVKPDHWLFAGTGMRAGERIPGLVGWEYHGDPPADIPGLEVVGAGVAFQGGERPQRWTATIYPGPKGNFVFNASTIFWAQGLSSPPGHVLPWSHWTRPHGPDERVQRMTVNLLQRACAPSRSAPEAR